MSLYSDVVGMKTFLLFWWLCARPSCKVFCFFSTNTNWCCGNSVSSPYCPPGGHEASLPPCGCTTWTRLEPLQQRQQLHQDSVQIQRCFFSWIAWFGCDLDVVGWQCCLFVGLGGLLCCLLFHRGIWRCCWLTSRRCRSQTVERGQIFFTSLVHWFLKFESHLFLCCRYRDKGSRGSV